MVFPYRNAPKVLVPQVIRVTRFAANGGAGRCPFLQTDVEGTFLARQVKYSRGSSSGVDQNANCPRMPMTVASLMCPLSGSKMNCTDGLTTNQGVTM